MKNQPVQIAFQGGGARLAAIIAAVEAIGDLRQRELLKPVTLSGTSAGAVGAVLASLPPGAAQTVAGYIRGLPGERIEKALPPLSKAGKIEKVFSLVKVSFGRPLASSNQLREILVDAFKECEITSKTELKDLPIPTKVVAADIRHATKKVFEGDAKVIDSLICSMSLPGIYSMPGARGGESSVVDGGLFSNLPAEELDYEPAKEEEYVPSIAISFRETDYGKHAETALQYVKQLLSAVVDEKVRATVKELGEENVCLVETSLSLFDSHKIVENLSGEPYATAKKSVFGFFDSWFPLQRQLRLDFARENRLSVKRRLDDIVATLSQYADDRRSTQGPVDADHIKMKITAHSLDSSDPEQLYDPYREDAVEIEMQIQKAETDLSVMSFKLFTPVDHRAHLEDVRWEVADSSGRKLNYYKFPVFSKDGKISRYILVFDPPLGHQKSGVEPFTIYYTQRISRLCCELAEKGEDTYAQSCGSFSSAKRLEVVYSVPRRFELNMIGINETDTFLRIMELEKNDIPPEFKLVEGQAKLCQERAGYRHYAWVASNVKQNDTLAVRYLWDRR